MRTRLLIVFAFIASAILPSRAALKAGTEYFIWLNIYEKLLGSNAASDGPALSAFGKNSNSSSYIFVAEDSGKSGYVLLKQKSSGKYLAASGSNSWSTTLESRSTDDRFCWAADEGTYTYLKNKKNSKYLGIDGAVKGNDYVSVYYDKVKGSHSQLTIIPATGGTYNAARAAYASTVYTNAQGVQEIDYIRLVGKTISRSDAVDIHLTANEDPMDATSKVNLGSDKTWLIFDNVKPSKVKSDYLKYVTVNGNKANADDGGNCRVAIFLNGAAVIPIPATIFTANGSTSFTLGKGSHTDLGNNSNTMTSFTLRRGYMATLASGRNGGGHSRVYVADHADLTIDLPTGALAQRVTSVYIKPWQYLSKKGYAGSSGGSGVRATWYWAWNASEWSSADMEYVPCRQHRWWPSADEVNSHASSAAFSLNEPEHSEQHKDCSCGGTTDAWTAYGFNSSFQASGARIGSPQPTDLSYLTTYFGYIDKNNNQSRCDFAVTHSYWDLGGRDANSYADWFCNTKCKGIWNDTGRPVWLTEMEVSASWNGSKMTSYEQNRQYLQALLQKIDECPWIERYAIYGTDMWQTYMYYEANPSKGPTPAGEVYRDHRATFAYNSNYVKTPVWWSPSAQKPELLFASCSNGVATFRINNPNTDMTSQLSIEGSANGTSWSAIASVTDRSEFEDATLVIDNVSVPTGMKKFRIAVALLSESTTQSDIFELGTIFNGNINAKSSSEIYGWTCFRAAANGYTKAESGDTYFEAWNPTPDGIAFDYYQTVTDLKDGLYRLQAKVFNSSNGIDGATVNDAVGLYAQTATASYFTPVVKDSEIGDADLLTIDNILVTDGQLRVGVRNLKPMTARWAGADDFTLEYLGTCDQVLGKSEENAAQDAIAAFLAKMAPVGTGTYDLSYFIHNPEVTVGSNGWTVKNAELNKGEAYDGKNSDPKNTYFDHWSASNHECNLEQTVTDLPPGRYVLGAMLRSAETFSLTLSATADSATSSKTFTGTGAEGSPDYPKGWYKVELDPITIAPGQELGIKLAGSGTSWWSADHFTLTYIAGEPGDVNGDGNVTPSDAIMILYHFFNASQTGFNAAAADLNGDGAITPADAIEALYKFFNSEKENQP